METRKIKISINGQEFLVKKDQTILEILQENGFKVPTLCYHPDLEIKSSCRICAVEVVGRKDLPAACSTKIENGMTIITDSEKVKRARQINLELIFAQHCEECNDCIWSFNCQLLNLAKEYEVRTTRFSDRKTDYPCYPFGPALVFDSSKCIDCQNCVEICARQGVNFLEIEEGKDFFKVIPSKNKKRDCIYCGQCLVHCPVGAFEAVGEFEEVEKPLQDKEKIVVVQFAPAVRTSIGEEFGLTPGSTITEKLVAGLRKLGFNKVFDVSVGADFTAVEEAGEFMEKLAKGDTPCMSSCCPAWVKFVEFYYPEFIPRLATARSPQVILGGLIKTYWAEKENLDPKKIVVVSIMPCVAKKYEIQRKELKVKGLKPVDYVLTTRELAWLFKKYGIDLANIQSETPDDPLGIPSGAGVIYGASGGVAESVLRIACENITKAKLPKIDFKELRGTQELKKAVIKIGDRSIKMAVVNGLENAVKILEELKKNPQAYDALEVMACFGGCVGGGGQPVPQDSKIREERAKGLYLIDKGKEIRVAHQNPVIKKIYQDFLTSKEKIHQICHTRYFKKQKEVNPR